MTASASGRLASAAAEFCATAALVSERTAKRASGRSLNRKIEGPPVAKDKGQFLTNKCCLSTDCADVSWNLCNLWMKILNLTIPETIRIVIVNHPDSLHERITDR